MPKAKYDVASLPKWAQRRIREAEQKAKELTFTAPYECIVQVPKTITLDVNEGVDRRPIHLAAGDRLALDRASFDKAIIDSIIVDTEIQTFQVVHPTKPNRVSRFYERYIKR